MGYLLKKLKIPIPSEFVERFSEYASITPYLDSHRNEGKIKLILMPKNESTEPRLAIYDTGWSTEYYDPNILVKGARELLENETNVNSIIADYYFLKEKPPMNLKIVESIHKIVNQMNNALKIEDKKLMSELSDACLDLYGLLPLSDLQDSGRLGEQLLKYETMRYNFLLSVNPKLTNEAYDYAKKGFDAKNTLLDPIQLFISKPLKNS